MLTALIIANIALTIGLMSTVNKIKDVKEKINDINLNLALIEINTDETKKEISKNKIDIIKEFNEIHKKALAYPPAFIIKKDGM